ncbi:MAG TPA: cation:proton antiporter, partial [Thermomicrobiales bacterium]|nr:cation:proton antiporter [Thermomicrobiales bacterium]
MALAEVELILALLVAVAALAALADRLALPYPILLVVGGAALGLVPGLPPIRLEPDLVFLLFVPPLVFVAAFFTSWRDFVAATTPIFSLAVGLVIATALAVAVVAHGVAGIAWAPAFALGAAVANTDTTATVAIAGQSGLPRRLVTILEGESLVNDAVGLTAFRFAVAATVAGTISPWELGRGFALAVFGALPIGFAVGWLTAIARARSSDPRIVTVIGLLTPFAAYLPAERIGASGILATVVAGLYVGRREAQIEDATARLEARAVWDMVIFIINGMLFILIGMQLRPIWDALAGGPSLAALMRTSAAVCVTVIAVRVVWVFAQA